VISGAHSVNYKEHVGRVTVFSVPNKESNLTRNIYFYIRQIFHFKCRLFFLSLQMMNQSISFFMFLLHVKNSINNRNERGKY
jgi:hypothetical protein